MTEHDATMQSEIDKAASVDSLKAAIAPAGNRED